jgi:ATP-dependent Lhr-like helicase
MRFLLDWHGLTDPPEGPDALAAALEQLEGFPMQAAAWERDILPARISNYAPHLLDQLLASGRFTWLRLTPPKQEGSRRGGPVRNTPIAIMERESLMYWRQVAPAPDRTTGKLSSGAARVLAALDEHGASFFIDLVEATGLLKSQVEEALGELVYRGLANADTFNGIRALVAPSNKRASSAPKYRRRRRTAPGVDAAGRWVRLRAQSTEEETDERPNQRMTDYGTLEHIAWTLLHRYGVVFRKILEREPALPPWRELLYAYRRLEARGDIKGGRFVQQFSGEQFAHPEAVGELTKMRRKEKDEDLVAVSAADPLNLVGIVTPGSRLPASGTNRVLYRNGIPVAFHQGSELRLLEELSPEWHWEIRQQLLRRAGNMATNTSALPH